MLIVGYCFGIRSERRLCEEVHLNLAYRWFCRLGLDGDVPDHSTFSKNRHGRYTASANSVAAYAYSDNYLIDLEHAVIMDVEATTAIRQAEVSAAKAMLDRTAEQFDLTRSRLAVSRSC